MLIGPWAVQDGLGVVLVRSFFRLAIWVPFFGPLGLLLVPSWGAPGPFWACLGVSWVRFGVLRGFASSLPMALQLFATRPALRTARCAIRIRRHPKGRSVPGQLSKSSVEFNRILRIKPAPAQSAGPGIHLRVCVGGFAAVLCGFSRCLPRSLQDGPELPQDRPKTPHGQPKVAPRRPKIDPRQPQVPPRSTQELR